MLTSALAPANTLPGNPAALRHAVGTGGHSLLRGDPQPARRRACGPPWPSQADTRPFRLGANLGATPGAVVFRNAAAMAEAMDAVVAITGSARIGTMGLCAGGQLLAMAEHDQLATPGGLRLLGTPVNLSRVTVPGYVIGAETDHLVSWAAAYATTRLLGG